MLIISVHIAHAFDCWTLVARKVSLTPCRDYDWLVCTLQRHCSTCCHPMPIHQLTYFIRARDCSMAAYTAYTVHTDRRPRSYCGLACWTLNRLQDSPTVVSTVTRTRISLWWNILYVPVPGWTHSTKLYPNIKICFHRILEQLVGTMNYFVCISVSEIYLETFHVWVTKTLLRPVHGAMICPKRRTLCSITVSKQKFHFNNFEIQQIVYCRVCKYFLSRRDNTKQLQSLIPETTFCEWTHGHVRVVQSRDTKRTRGAIREPLRNNSHIIKAVIFN